MGRPLLHQIFEQITPIGIGLLDQFDFPSATPPLDSFFTRDGDFYVVMGFAVNERGHAIATSEFTSNTGTMFMDPTGDIIRYARVKRSVPTAGKYVDIIGHKPIIGLRGSRLKAGMTPLYFTTYGSRLSLRSAGMTTIFYDDSISL